MDFNGLCVVVRNEHWRPRAQMAFPGASVLVPHGMAVGRQFDRIICLYWTPETDEDHRWVDEGLKARLGHGCNGNVFYLP